MVGIARGGARFMTEVRVGEKLEERRRKRRDKAKGTGAAGDSVHLYLREIGTVALLTGPEEIALAKRIQAGLIARPKVAELDSTEACPIISEAEQAGLRADAADGDIAFEQLTAANLRLVVSIAKRYSRGGNHLLDLVQDGNVGLMRAVEKFDHTRGFKFSTYASWWIRQAIARSAGEQSRTIRLPSHLVDVVNRIIRTQRDMVQELGREPTLEETARATDLPVERIRELLDVSRDPLSLDTPRGEEEDSSLGDFIEDTDALAPADAVTRTVLAETVREVLADLPDRDREVMEMRFGLNGARPATLEDVGKAMGVTRERIRQIEAKTLARLRHPEQSRRLRDFLESS
ncbi:MAG: RNA polymerase primary sigma factor [Candidatus Poriferisodalaceae bacterium]|jgi:RNA polymerase primary sigma factor